MRTYDAEQREEAAAHRVAAAFLRKLGDAYDVAEVIMFGSRARRSQAG
jgi:predicted nucleotidyltransferase